MSNQIQPLVSIICYAYNHENYIRETLDGFVMQKTDFPVEIVIHDDASTDNTANIIRAYESKYPDMFKPIYQTINQFSLERGRVTKICYQAAKGKYIAMCEGDDYWTDPLKLQKQFDFLEKNEDCVAIANNALVLNDNGYKSSFGVKPSRYITEKDVFKSRQFATGSILFRNLAHIDLSLPKGVLAGDTPIMLKLLKHGKIYYDNIITSIYRRGIQGVTATFNDDNVKQRLLDYQYYMHSLLIKKQELLLKTKVENITGNYKFTSQPLRLFYFLDAILYKVLVKLFRLKRSSSYDTEGCFSLLKIKYMLTYKQNPIY